MSLVESSRACEWSEKKGGESKEGKKANEGNSEEKKGDKAKR